VGDSSELVDPVQNQPLPIALPTNTSEIFQFYGPGIRVKIQKNSSIGPNPPEHYKALRYFDETFDLSDEEIIENSFNLSDSCSYF